MKRSVITTLLLLTVLTGFASAQSRGSFLFDNSLLRSKLNPAFAPKTDYATFPVLGSLSADMASNVGLKHFIFPEGDKNYLFLNDNVSSETFLSQLPGNDPYVQERVESDLFGAGMRMGRNGYATFSLSLVENGSATLSKGLLLFAKTGDAGDAQGVFDGGTVRAAGYAALSAGYSHDLSAFVEGLRAGVRLKLLIGLAAADLSVDRIGLQFGEEQVSASIHGNGTLSGIGYDAKGGFSFPGFNPRNLGAAIDLGASYRLPLEGPVSGIEFSASVSDLGAIRFKQSLTALSLDNRFSFTGISDFSGNIKEEMEQLTSDIKSLADLETADGQPYTYTLPASVHIGATASLLQDKAKAGLLYYHAVGHSNLMAACGYSPFEWLNVGVNWTFLGPANRFGLYAEIIPRKYVGFFVGMERASWRRNGSQLPIRNFTESYAFGLNVLFGE